MRSTATGSLFIATLITLSLPVRAAVYSLVDNWEGSSFLTEFTHEAIPDPTNGRVQYVTEQEALQLGLTSTSSPGSSEPHIILRADATEKLTPGGPGRKSVRVQSKKKYGHGTVLVADVLHMPEGCGTWPALWSTDVNDWPSKGEIDIIEGVNDQSPNQVSLHTSPNCIMKENRAHTGLEKSQNCDAKANNNSGCGVAMNKPNSFGPGFNANGGGIYALERQDIVINAYFWPRGDPSTPADVLSLGQKEVDTGNWGTPVAKFIVSDQCELQNKHGDQNVIINLTFCGDWAGNAYPATCPKNCVAFVEENPEAFVNAFWDFRAIRMYRPEKEVRIKKTGTIIGEAIKGFRELFGKKGTVRFAKTK